MVFIVCFYKNLCELILFVLMFLTLNLTLIPTVSLSYKLDFGLFMHFMHNFTFSNVPYSLEFYWTYFFCDVLVSWLSRLFFLRPFGLGYLICYRSLSPRRVFYCHCIIFNVRMHLLCYVCVTVCHSHFLFVWGYKFCTSQRFSFENFDEKFIFFICLGIL